MIEHAGLGSYPLQDELTDLHAQAIRWFATGESLVAYGIILVWGLTATATGLQDIVVAGLLGGSAVAAWVLVDRNGLGAAATMLVGLLASIAAGAILWTTGELVYALPLVLFVAPLLLGPRRALVFSLGEVAFVGVLAELQLLPLPPAAMTGALLLIVASAALSWVAYQPVRTMLAWTWASYQQERAKTRELRAQQAELARLSKSLSEACDRLEQANAALAEARRAAEEARRLKDEFAMAISHELRTPINLILGFSEMIVNDAGDDPAAFRSDVETIYRNACHLSTLVDDVLDLGRLDAQRLALVKQWTPVMGIAREAVEAVRGLYDNAGIQIQADLPTDLPPLYLDPTRIRQVFINLLTNAVRYVEEGSVKLSARGAESEVVISVADTGVGISPEDLPYVFERFQQIGQLGRRGGFGLGLTVSKQLIETHAGSMWVTSAPGEGTTFSFSLPIASNVVPLACNPRLELLEAQHLGGPRERTVLVAGPDEEANRIFERYLDGYQVQVASTACGVRALDHGQSVDAVVVSSVAVDGSQQDGAAADDGTGRSDGLARALHDCFRGVPRVSCSLHTITHASRQLGVAAFLTKPVTGEQLRRTLRRRGVTPRRALIVDDDPDMVRLLARTLRTIAPRCQVHAATSGEEGGVLTQELAESSGLDVILLDLLMPGPDGHALIQRWRADPALCDVPVIVISAASEEDHDLVIGESVEIRRGNGLSVAELMRIVRGSLDQILTPVR